jgi:hypothetical protein
MKLIDNIDYLLNNIYINKKINFNKTYIDVPFKRFAKIKEHKEKLPNKTQ